MMGNAGANWFRAKSASRSDTTSPFELDSAGLLPQRSTTNSASSSPRTSTAQVVETERAPTPTTDTASAIPMELIRVFIAASSLVVIAVPNGSHCQLLALRGTVVSAKGHNAGVARHARSSPLGVTEHTTGSQPPSSPGVCLTTVASPVSAELVETLRASGRIRHLRRGERLVHEGGRHGSVLLLISGTVRVLSYTVDGSEVLLAIRGPGELVGDFSPITGSAASATVEAREPTEVALTSSVRFRELVESSPTVAFELLRRLVDMFNEAEQRLIERSTLPVRTRLARANSSGTPKGRPVNDPCNSPRTSWPACAARDGDRSLQLWPRCDAPVWSRPDAAVSSSSSGACWKRWVARRDHHASPAAETFVTAEVSCAAHSHFGSGLRIVGHRTTEHTRTPTWTDPAVGDSDIDRNSDASRPKQRRDSRGCPHTVTTW